MRFSILAGAFAALISTAACANSTEALPVNYGFVLFPAFTVLDVFGPMDILTLLSSKFRMNLYLIAETLDPVSSKPRSAAMNLTGSNFGQSTVPTHTFETAPPLDVLFIPGGAGTRAPDLNNTRAFIKKTYPTVKYLVTVCTGSGLAASAGVLDGKKATSNKAAWLWATGQGPNVDWVPRARWTVDGNIWTTSGVAAGMDGTFAFVEEIYGKEVTTWIENLIEYERHLDASWDPWGDFYNTTWPIV